MTPILIVRKQDETAVLFGVFLVDLYCLGVKDAFCNANITLSKYRDDIRSRFAEEHDMVTCPFELAHQIIYGAIDYAAELGFRPHTDFSLAKHVLEDREAIPPNRDIEFGKDGKPLFVSGPHDNVKRIMAQLDKKLGKDGYYFLIGGAVG